MSICIGKALETCQGVIALSFGLFWHYFQHLNSNCSGSLTSTPKTLVGILMPSLLLLLFHSLFFFYPFGHTNKGIASCQDESHYDRTISQTSFKQAYVGHVFMGCSKNRTTRKESIRHLKRGKTFRYMGCRSLIK